MLASDGPSHKARAKEEAMNNFEHCVVDFVDFENKPAKDNRVEPLRLCQLNDGTILHLKSIRFKLNCGVVYL